MTQSWTKFELATGKAEELNKLVHRQAMFAIEHFLVPARLVLGKETAMQAYGSLDFKSFRVEGYEIPVDLVDGDVVYLVGGNP